MGLNFPTAHSKNKLYLVHGPVFLYHIWFFQSWTMPTAVKERAQTVETSETITEVRDFHICLDSATSSSGFPFYQSSVLPFTL